MSITYIQHVAVDSLCCTRTFHVLYEHGKNRDTTIIILSYFYAVNFLATLLGNF